MEQTKTAIRSEHRLQTCTTVEKYDTIKQEKYAELGQSGSTTQK